MKHFEEYRWLDLFRGLSALIVPLGHLWNPLFTEIRPLDTGAAWPWVLVHFIGGKYHSAVIVFFVLSGFFVGGSVLRSLPAFSWKDFLVARLSRLWIVVVPSLGLAVGAVWLARWAWQSPAPASFTARDFLGNLVFLQTWLVRPFTPNGPLWSLAYEFWYYILFALLAVGCAALKAGLPGRRLRGGLWLLGACALALALDTDMEKYFPLWLIGALAYALVQRMGRRRRWAALAFFGLLLAGVLLNEHSLFDRLGQYSYDLLLAAVFGAFCTVLVSSGPPLSLGWLVGFARASTEISFSLYATHAPIIYLLSQGYFQGHPLSMDLRGALAYAACYALLLAVGILTWWLFERHYLPLRRRVMARL